MQVCGANIAVTFLYSIHIWNSLGRAQVYSLERWPEFRVSFIRELTASGTLYDFFGSLSVIEQQD